MKTKLSLSSAFLAFSGFILMGLGLYFILMRPPLLPEDPRYMGTTLVEIRTAMPGLLTWLRRVFWVMGGFIFSTGILITYIAIKTFRQPMNGARSVVALASLASIGWMTVVNFMLDSDFKWLLLAFNLPWLAALTLSWQESKLAQP
jgi:hypothetical protein